jgi:hypothetical protein
LTLWRYPVPCDGKGVPLRAATDAGSGGDLALGDANFILLRDIPVAPSQRQRSRRQRLQPVVRFGQFIVEGHFDISFVTRMLAGVRT